ncbi:MULTISPECIES: SDR family NAD(P)-dependent oxidoreductase [Marinovum]|uniref:SDR family NAD(P)-dependent oxidoreductase n=1 Tax=Marinovum TaxID=367771 RepID=UPI00237B94C6|nr:SDR family oxidoreductase [Marinovum sp. PR37]MDD9743972.1 SDR family oxidoreductase [Marinovum sp. PR37]
MRRVLVTGGGTGIGLAIARAFAAAGEGVTISGRREAPLRAAAAAGGFDWITADVTCEDDMPRLFARPFDVVVANAGSGQPAKIADLTLAQWNATLAVNLTGTFLTFRAALAGMPAGGRLIALASTASLQGGAAIPAYAAAKHGVLGLVRSVAQDVALRGITCNAICPGFVDTDMAQAATEGLMKRFDIPRDEAVARLVGGNPMRRLIDPEEVAATALFLASEGAAAINGHALSISGGEI